jgi:hypothetical protein
MRSLAALVLAAVALASASQAQVSGRGPLFDAAWSAWHRPDYREAYRLLGELREQPYGREAVVDFMLGTSACRIVGVEPYGARVLDWMLYAYALTLDSRQIVQGERDLCAGAVAAVAPRPGEIVELRSAGMTGYGKTFYWASEAQQPVTSYPIRRTRELDRAELTARLVPPGDPGGALALARGLAPGAPAVAVDGLLIVGHAGQSEADLRSIAALLGDYRDFLVRTYGVLAPPYHVRVELVPGSWEVQALADARHALDVSPATIGYAFVDDASIIAAVPETAAGTVLHEMFHLLVRSNFGDVPQWLDEGIASAYEVSAREGDRFVGRDNWRRQVLEETWPLRPDVETLIRTEWFLFDDPQQAGREPGELDPENPETEAQRAASMAMARYFAMYLDQRGALAPIYHAVRANGLAGLDGDPGAHVVGIVEDITGQDAASLDRDFAAWFSGERRAPPMAVAERGPLHVTTANLNVRSGPGTDFEKLATLPQGSVFASSGSEGGWLMLELSDGTTGYVSRDFTRPIDAVGKWQPD